MNNLGTVLVAALLLFGLAAFARYLYKKRKSGSCCGDCGACSACRK
jgi:hypothetical protein